MLATVTGAPTTSLAVYAFTLGLVAAFNPCGFPILPAYLTLAGADGPAAPLAVRVLRALGSGAAVTAGFVLVFGALGLASEAGIGLAYGWLPWVMVPVGVACFAIGVLTIAGRRVPLRVPSRRLFAGRRRGVALVGFGVTYAVASLACALPLFISGVAGTFGRRGVAEGLACGLSYALGMGLVITAVSLAGIGAQQIRLHGIRAAQPVLQRVAGAILALVGAYLVLYWLNDALSPLSTPGPVRVVERIQNRIQIWLSASPRTIGAFIAAIVLVALGAACVHLMRHGAEPPAPDPTARGRKPVV